MSNVSKFILWVTMSSSKGVLHLNDSLPPVPTGNALPGVFHHMGPLGDLGDSFHPRLGSFNKFEPRKLLEMIHKW